MNEYPYFNPYAPYMPMQNGAYTSANQIEGVRFVANHQEAKNCAAPRGTKALLMDSNKDIFYLKETDINGAAHVKTLLICTSNLKFFGQNYVNSSAHFLCIISKIRFKNGRRT